MVSVPSELHAPTPSSSPGRTRIRFVSEFSADTQSSSASPSRPTHTSFVSRAARSVDRTSEQRRLWSIRSAGISSPPDRVECETVTEALPVATSHVR